MRRCNSIQSYIHEPQHTRSSKVGLDRLHPQRLVGAVRVRREGERVRGVEGARGPGSEAEDAVLVGLHEGKLGAEVLLARRGVAAAGLGEELTWTSVRRL
jgi:hypothetical protein